MLSVFDIHNGDARHQQKSLVVKNDGAFFCSVNGRDGKIRTYDPLYPKQVRYQAAPRPDNRFSYYRQ